LCGFFSECILDIHFAALLSFIGLEDRIYLFFDFYSFYCYCETIPGRNDNKILASSWYAIRINYLEDRHCSFSFFGGPRAWTQGFALTKQVLYYLGCTSSSVLRLCLYSLSEKTEVMLWHSSFSCTEIAQINITCSFHIKLLNALWSLGNVWDYLF
jgi:hypothetical protein